MNHGISHLDSHHQVKRVKTDIDHTVNRFDMNDAWGDAMDAKADTTIRLAFENINGLGFDISSVWKHNRFVEIAKEYAFDIVGWAEVNTNWKLTKYHQRIRERLKEGHWDKLAINTAHNTNEKLHRYQPGGCSMIAFDQFAFRVASSGSDRFGLGRWTWQLIRGKAMNTRIITTYRPCKSNRDDSNTAYAQQRRYFHYIAREEICPRQAFLRDL